MRHLGFALAAVLLSLPVSAATLEVRVARPDGSAVENGVVYAVPSRPLPLQRKVAVMDQKDRVFIPHVLPVQSGTWVEFPNSDNIRHQVFSVSPARRFQLPLYVGKPARPIQFPTPGVVAIGCNIHEQMSAYIVVVDTPFFGTVEDGRVTLRDLSADDYTIHLWYPGLKGDTAMQKVKLGATDSQTISLLARP